MSREDYLALTTGNKPGRSKYNAKKTEVDGIIFDSKKEAKRYTELKILEQTGEITGLQRQVPYELIPEQRDESGKVLEQACRYKADFVYRTKDGKEVVEDAKGAPTEVYKIKRKLMLEKFGIRISEV